MVAEYYAATGKREGLLSSDIDGSARARVRDIERSIVHYGDTTLFIADQMRDSGPAYASAVAMEEATLLEFNQDRAGSPELVAIYPKEGTFFSDNPFFVLEGAVGVAGAAGGRRGVPEVPRRKDHTRGRRRVRLPPADLNEKPARADHHGERCRSLAARADAVAALARVLAKIREAWREDRKPANVMLVVDVSGSMAEEDASTTPRRGWGLLQQIQPQDRVGLTVFDDQVEQLVPIEPFNQAEPS